ncbi:MAG: hypothetical protein JXX28_10390 [Deltaproteobacteria bacterium]|nr:hypothetical protein [Deltaproteobacteria bacterium]
MPLYALLLPVLLGCSEPDETGTEDPSSFVDSTYVRITNPAEGATVEASFWVSFAAGADVDKVRLQLDGEVITAYLDPAERKVEVSASSGRHRLIASAYDAGRALLSQDIVNLRVLPSDAEGGWVSIQTPVDGSHPVDPVQVVVETSDNLDTVRLFADGYLLGEVGEGGVFTADFATVGYARQLEARGYADGEQRSVDAITITPEQGEDPGPSSFNQLVLDLIDTYPEDGTYSYYWPTSGGWSGSTRDIWYQDRLIADDGGYSSCYCSGITWELFLRAWGEWDRSHGGDGEDLNGLSADEVMTMRGDWYVRELDGPGPSTALISTGTGDEVPSFADWRPGDFVQLWRRSGSGHTVVFDGWITDAAGNRLGMAYVSCQGSTDGFGHHDEYFGTGTSALDPSKLYAGRALMPADWY